MRFRTLGVMVTLLFVAFAAHAATRPDPWLAVIVYLSAAATGLATARARPVLRWVALVLVVFPAELGIVTLLFEPPRELAAARTPVEMLTRDASVESTGMLLVACWALLLTLARPFHPDDAPEM